MEEQQEDNRRTGVRRGRRASFKTRRRRDSSSTWTIGCLGWLLLFNSFFLLAGFEGFKRGIAVLVSLQSLALAIGIVLIWRHRHSENPTQYFLIALGFYLLMLGVCASSM